MDSFNEQDFKRNMVLFLDGELNTEESAAFLEKTVQTPEFYNQFQNEKSFRELLRQKAGQRTASTELIQNIQSKIASGNIG